MKTTEIISSQFNYINNNSKELLNICFPYFLIFSISYYVSEDSLYFIPVILIEYIVAALMIVNIHRYIILDDKKNYYSFSKRLKPTFIYICYSLLLLAVSFFPMILFGVSFFLIDVLPIPISLVIIGILFLIMIFCLFLVYPSFALNLPMAAVGEKVEFFKMWKLSKGFKLTIFLQFLIITIILLLIITPLYFWLGDNLLWNLVSSFFGVIAYALLVSCLSKTYLLWKEKNIQVM